MVPLCRVDCGGIYLFEFTNSETLKVESSLEREATRIAIKTHENSRYIFFNVIIQI